MMTEGMDGMNLDFSFGEAWANFITELLLREEFEPRGNKMDILQYIFSLHIVSPTPPPPASSIPQLPDNQKSSKTRAGIPISEGLNEIHIVIDLPNAP